MAVFAAESLVLKLAAVPIATVLKPTSVCAVLSATVTTPREDPKLITVQSML